MEKCKQTKKHRYKFTIFAITRRVARCAIAWKTLRRPRIFLRLDQRSKATVDQRREDNFMQKKDNFAPLVVPGLSANSGSNSSLTSTLQDLSPTYVQPKSEVTNKLQETGAHHSQNPQSKKKEGCEDSDNRLRDLLGWRSSQMIWRTQNCMHPHTVLMIEIRNVLRKWHSRSTVFKNSLPRRPKLRTLLANQNDKGSIKIKEAQYL